MTSSADAGSGGRTLVTGASGFIGSQLVRTLVRRGADVVALVRPTSDTWRLADVADWIEVVRADPAELDATTAARRLRDVRRVFHLAAAGVNAAEGDAASIVRANVVGTTQMLEVAARLDVERFVYSGSCFEYGSGESLHETAPLRPASPYAASKAAGSLLAGAYARTRGLPTVSLRPFTAYGPFEAPYRLVPSVILRALDGSPIDLTGGEQTRDFVYVGDVVDGFLAAAEADVVNETFNLCTGVATSVRELVKTVLELIGSDSQPRFGAVPYRDDELWTLSGDPSAATTRLGWTAQTSLRDGLARTIDWFRTEGERHAAYTREPAQL